ncbi:hypothetical protein K440DRAFT_657961 [Wilcoxina mikolae CBS 423.85]|nr:hypothetical protein K440DRAFT_657961 [Wilcoxina mikolae CBS 423.85]
MAVMDPTGGLRPISLSTPSVFTEDLHDQEAQQNDDWTPLVQQKPVPTLTLRKPSFDWRKFNHRTRLFFRIVSLVASGASFGALSSVLYSFFTTRYVKSHHDNNDFVWPQNMHLHCTILMLSAAIVTFLSDLAFFGASVKVNVRSLDGVKLKAIALADNVVCLVLMVAAKTVEQLSEKNRRNVPTLSWTCHAKTLHWDEAVTVDFPFLCGEVIASRLTMAISLGCQVFVLATILIDCFWRTGPRKPKLVVSKEFKVVKGWTKFTDMFSRSR